jgi:acyl carrier protein
MTELEKKIREYIVENFLFGEDDDLDNNDSFLEKGLLDSTGVLVLVDHLEDTHGIEVGGDEITPDNLDSISLIAAYVERKEKEQNKQPTNT